MFLNSGTITMFQQTDRLFQKMWLLRLISSRDGSFEHFKLKHLYGLYYWMSKMIMFFILYLIFCDVPACLYGLICETWNAYMFYSVLLMTIFYGIRIFQVQAKVIWAHFVSWLIMQLSCLMYQRAFRNETKVSVLA